VLLLLLLLLPSPPPPRYCRRRAAAAAALLPWRTLSRRCLALKSHARAANKLHYSSLRHRGRTVCTLARDSPSLRSDCRQLSFSFINGRRFQRRLSFQLPIHQQPFMCAFRSCGSTFE
jgi:hypothetical protein